MKRFTFFVFFFLMAKSFAGMVSGTDSYGHTYTIHWTVSNPTGTTYKIHRLNELVYEFESGGLHCWDKRQLGLRLNFDRDNFD